MRAAAALALAAALGACLPLPSEDSRAARDLLLPPGPARGGPEVDPLVVGDRLLAAGEAELALDAYARAGAGPAGVTLEVKAAVARADIALGRLGQARTLLREVVAERPRDAAARNDLGVVLYELGETGEAHRMFQSAFALRPVPEIRANLRLSAARLGLTVGDAEPDGRAALTRRGDGVYVLGAPEDRP